MCGIVGFCGKNNKLKNIVKILKKLEYRGYDSSGVAYFENNVIKTIKSVGNISNLEKKVDDGFQTSCAIAHTRWATHGKPNEQNAHPHSSCGGVWTVVHNGIIENFSELKPKLSRQPTSETDTAVVPCLLEEQNVQDIQGFIDVCCKLKGSFAIVAARSDCQNTLFIAKNKSPLYVSKSESGEFLIASDPICFVGFSKEFYSLSDQEFALVKSNELNFFDGDGCIILKQTKQMNNLFESVQLHDYPHFMIKEIFEQSDALRRLIRVYETSAVFEKFDDEFILQFNQIKLIGCGTAYHASMMGAKFLSKQTGIFASAEMASEFIYETPVFADEKTLFIFVSQSGETADTLQALEIAKIKKAKTIALTNVLYSTLASKCDFVLPVCAGPEIAVASTKAYVCQLAVLYMFSAYLKSKLTKTKQNYFLEIKRVADKILSFDKTQIEDIAKKIKHKNDTVFIGKGCDYITACEASLKLKEVTYVNSASYPSGELKHGFLALVENETPLIVFAGDEKINSKTLNSMHEAASRGANVILVTNQKYQSEKNVVIIDEQNEMLFSILSIVPLQYLAYNVSILRKINPDQPRNLAKSVTVE